MSLGAFGRTSVDKRLRCEIACFAEHKSSGVRPGRLLICCRATRNGERACTQYKCSAKFHGYCQRYMQIKIKRYGAQTARAAYYRLRHTAKHLERLGIRQATPNHRFSAICTL